MLDLYWTCFKPKRNSLYLVLLRQNIKWKPEKIKRKKGKPTTFSINRLTSSYSDWFTNIRVVLWSPCKNQWLAMNQTLKFVTDTANSIHKILVACHILRECNCELMTLLNDYHQLSLHIISQLNMIFFDFLRAW